MPRMPAPPAAKPLPPQPGPTGQPDPSGQPAPLSAPRHPPQLQLQLQTLDRGDGLLGLRPCGPVRPPARTPLFGARGPQVTVARLRACAASQPAAAARLRALGLHPLPAGALQWRGEASPLSDEPLWSLVREAEDRKSVV